MRQRVRQRERQRDRETEREMNASGLVKLQAIAHGVMGGSVLRIDCEVCVLFHAVCGRSRLGSAHVSGSPNVVCTREQFN